MSDPLDSFAELTLFLSSDRELQVRAHVTKKGVHVFCVKDFICQTADSDLGPEESMLVWIYAVGKLIHEDHILDNIPVQFAGPYEGPCICISAEGLLILYHFMDEQLSLVNDVYRSEIQNVLADVASGNNLDIHIHMHDDGEIRELMAEKGNEIRSSPPVGSKYIFMPTIANEDGIDIPAPIYVVKQKSKEEELLEKINELEKKNTELINEAKKHEQAISKFEERGHLKERKRKRKEGFCVQELCLDTEFHISQELVPQLCKNVISAFRAAFPAKETFVKHGKTFFYPEDKEIVTALLNEEHLHLQLKRMDQDDEIEMGIGADRFHNGCI